MPTTSRFYDIAAGFYDDTRAFAEDDTRAIAALMHRMAGLQPTARMIEIGIGTGRLVVPMLPYVAEIYGVDISLPMLWRLRGKHPDRPIYAMQANARRLPISSAVFDAALTAHFFNLMPDWQAALDEIARVLRPDGVLLNAWHRDFHKESWWRVWLNALPPNRRDAGLPLPDQHDVLVALGWRPLGQQQAHTVARRLSPQQFLEQLAGRVWTSTWALSESQLAAAIRLVHEAMLLEYDNLDVEIEFDSHFTIYAYHPPLT